MITKELVEHIKNQIALGKDKATIKQELISVGGWSSFDVEEVFNIKRSGLRNLCIAVLFVFIILGGFGYIYIHRDSSVSSPSKIVVEDESLSQDKTNESVIQPKTDILNSKKSSGNLLVLIEDNLFSGLENELNTYTADVKRELGWSTEIRKVISADDIFSLKSFVKDYYKDKGLDGVLLIGDVPTGNLYHSEVDTGSIFNSQGYILSDSIYQDVNDDCIYSVRKQAFDYKKIECQTGTTLQPYWVARLTPNSTTESALSQLKSYFERNHKFRTGDITFNARQLAYMPILVEFPGAVEDTRKFKESFIAYKNYISSDLVFIDPMKSSSDKEYLSAISEPYKYEAITFNGHGLPDFHQKNIYPDSIGKTSFVFLDLLSCSVGRFTTPDYLAGKYLFKGGLITLAASVPVYASSVFDRNMYVLLSQGVPFFRAFEFGGLGSNILGDPTLKMRYAHMSQSDARLEVSSKELWLSESGTDQTVTLKNTGSEPLLFDARMKFLKQKNSSGLIGTSYVQDASVITGDNKPNMIMPGKTGTLSFQPGYAVQTKDLPAGTYEAKFLIVSNDPQNPFIEIPVHYTK